jgi:hypothetical protein
MTHLASRTHTDFSSPLRHPRFLIGSCVLGALLALDLAALLMGRLT